MPPITFTVGLLEKRQAQQSHLLCSASHGNIWNNSLQKGLGTAGGALLPPLYVPLHEKEAKPWRGCRGRLGTNVCGRGGVWLHSRSPGLGCCCSSLLAGSTHSPARCGTLLGTPCRSTQWPRARVVHIAEPTWQQNSCQAEPSRWPEQQQATMSARTSSAVLSQPPTWKSALPMDSP